MSQNQHVPPEQMHADLNVLAMGHYPVLPANLLSDRSVVPDTLKDFVTRNESR